MSPLALLFVLAIGWMAITGSFTLANLALGALIAAIVLWLLRGRPARPIAQARTWRILALVLFFLKELLLSALSVASLVLSPRLASRLKPAIVAFPLSVKSDAEITLLANLITLTPGTLTLDVSADRRWLYIHVLSLGDEEKLIARIANGFEKKVRDIFV
ncbi:MAG: Na+/H+ antiporter subunit E [Devosia sp.]|nr:Na+/H+ antiporter subunit E [Devosia sp.]